MYDVCIIGAGPAGSTLARLIGGRYRVLLADKRPLDLPLSADGATKLCGGLLAPRAQAELARQGLGVPHEVVAGQQLFAVRTVDLSADLERLYQRFYVNLDRERFDRWLVSLVPARVDTAFGWRAEKIEQDAESPMVRFVTPGGGKAGVQARLIVGADGASSLVRRMTTSAWRSAPQYVAVQGRYAAGGADPYYGAFFDESLTDFYGWTIPKGDSLVVGAAFPSCANARERFGAFISGLRSRGYVPGPVVGVRSAPIVRPSHPAQVAFGAGRAVLVGEAAGLISPSSAEGISFALRSGAVLAEACESGLDGVLDRYRAAALPLGLEVASKMVKSSAIYGPMVRRAVMRSGLGAIPAPSVVPIGEVLGV